MRKSGKIAAFLMLSSSKTEEVSQNSFAFKLADRQIDRETTTPHYSYNYATTSDTATATTTTTPTTTSITTTTFSTTLQQHYSYIYSIATSTASTTLQLQLHYEYSYNCNYNYITNTATNSNTITLHFAMPHYILKLWVRWPLPPLQNSQPPSVHQWIRSAIHSSQQLTSPIVYCL